eukprot:7379158-Prymnesium_polylepis.2
MRIARCAWLGSHTDLWRRSAGNGLESLDVMMWPKCQRGASVRSIGIVVRMRGSRLRAHPLGWGGAVFSR